MIPLWLGAWKWPLILLKDNIRQSSEQAANSCHDVSIDPVIGYESSTQSGSCNFVSGFIGSLRYNQANIRPGHPRWHHRGCHHEEGEDAGGAGCQPRRGDAVRRDSAAHRRVGQAAGSVSRAATEPHTCRTPAGCRTGGSWWPSRCCR